MKESNFWLILQNSLKKHPITTVLIAINTVAFVLTLVLGGFTTENLVRLGGLVPSYVITNHEYLRMVATMFLHGGFAHFLMNMLALYYLGNALEDSIGPWKFGLLYALAGLASSFAVILLSPANQLTVGASGAIYGIMGGLLMITFLRPHWFTPQSVRSIRMMMIINLGITIVIPNISVAGHIGGLVMGIALIWLLLPKDPYFRRFHQRFDHGHETVGDADVTIVS